jgi:N,N'-diacetyllegionaminate synthase
MDNMVEAITIGRRIVGRDHPCFIIAEAGVNHNGSLPMALRLIDEASKAGADAVKFQTFKADRLVTINAAKAAYQLEGTDPLESQYEMLRRLELSPAAHRELTAHCRQRGILFMSTPFDEDSANSLADLGVEVFKIPSGEITNQTFLAHVARFALPLIISTGMSNLSEVDAAVSTVRGAGNDQCVLLHCVSNYPADPADVNLRAMKTMRQTFHLPVGYSDHTSGIEVALAAVALGACVVEKHFTLDRDLAGPDHRASLEPGEFRKMVEGIRTVESALGHGRKEPAASEANTAAVARKSLVAARDIPVGTQLDEQMIVCKRPGTGLPPAMLPALIGRRTRIVIRAGELFSEESFV